MKSNRTWDLYVIQHSHTDIGYTERQDKIIRYHYDFIRQAIEILDGIHEQGKKEWEGFVWQCENYWQVENFYEMADEALQKKFERYASTGEIGLSGNYLNMTELVSKPVIEAALDKMEAYGRRLHHPITAGMSADINGMSWGYGEELYRHGVRYFYSCLHSHHGMFPLYRKNIPFYWETPQGNRLLVWNGDHYQLGNEMFLAPHAGGSYMVQDEFTPPLRQYAILDRDAADTEHTELSIAAKRLVRYLDNLEEEGYPYDLAPLMVSGAGTDNAPPSKTIAMRLEKLNRFFDGKIRLKMVNLEQFFCEAEKRCADIPVYRGDWTDWWADGVGSTPAEVKLYREAVRKYSLCKELDPKGELGNRELVEKAGKDLMLYAEHTWGFSSSVSEPWESLVSALELKKGAYAVNANTHIAKNLDQLLAAKGEVSIHQGMRQNYRIINPHNEPMYTKACLFVENWEYLEGVRFQSSMPIEVIDAKTKERIPSQVKQTARAVQVEIELAMAAREERNVKIRLAEKTYKTTQNYARIGADGVADLLERDGFRRDTDIIETDAFRICMDDVRGIFSVIAKAEGRELIREDAKVGAFCGVYEITDIEEDACQTRRKMGRNRKSAATRRYTGVLKDRRIVEDGELYTAAALDYSLEGTRMYTVFLKVYKHQAKLETMVRIHKESRWEPENLYVVLPFTAGKESAAYVDKMGCIIRPGMDQLPGSCQDFYLIQNGVLWQDGDTGVAVITKDAPLIAMGDLKAHPITLSDGADWRKNQEMMYSWVMNNFWETNFKVNLGGFYEFSYTLLLEKGKNKEQAFGHMKAENEGLLAYNIL